MHFVALNLVYEVGAIVIMACYVFCYLVQKEKSKIGDNIHYLKELNSLENDRFSCIN